MTKKRAAKEKSQWRVKRNRMKRSQGIIIRRSPQLEEYTKTESKWAPTLAKPNSNRTRDTVLEFLLVDLDLTPLKAEIHKSLLELLATQKVSTKVILIKGLFSRRRASQMVVQVQCLATL